MLSRKVIPLLATLLAGCSQVISPAASGPPAPREGPAGTGGTPGLAAATDSNQRATLAPTRPAATVTPAPTNVRVTDTADYRYPQILPFDTIPPIYSPRFDAAQDAFLLPDELVMGVAIGEEAKAYAVSVLRFREMVNDELGGIPILVTW